MEIMVVYKHNKEFWKKNNSSNSVNKNSDHQKIREKNSQKKHTQKTVKRLVAEVPLKSAKIGTPPKFF